MFRKALAPFIGGFRSRYLYCKMREPLVHSCTMPVLYFCRNVDAVARLHLDRFLGFYITALIMLAASPSTMTTSEMIATILAMLCLLLPAFVLLYSPDCSRITSRACCSMSSDTLISNIT